MSPTVHEITHPLTQHHLGQLRSIHTSASDFRYHVDVLSTLLTSEATRQLKTESCDITTPVEETKGRRLNERIAVVPIMRAGLGMLDSFTTMIPQAEVWHLGLYRDEATAQPVHYYDKLPSNNPADVAFILDPMLATGGSATAAIQALQKWGVPTIHLLSIIAAPDGIQRVNEEASDVSVFTCAVDRQLNEANFICPGLGDAGDRIFNT